MNFPFPLMCILFGIPLIESLYVNFTGEPIILVARAEYGLVARLHVEACGGAESPTFWGDAGGNGGFISAYVSVQAPPRRPNEGAPQEAADGQTISGTAFLIDPKPEQACLAG